LVLLLKVSALAGAPLPVLLAAPVWARWLLLLAARRPAARPGGMAARWDLALTWPQLLAAGLLPLAVTAIGGSWHWPLWLAAPAAGLAGWGVLRLAERRLGGVTGDVFGAVVETSEAVFVCAACLQPFPWT
jgi:adenosylcobinamide-GDP ribazoletransferase